MARKFGSPETFNGFTFSQIVSKLLAEFISLQEGLLDVRMYHAPIECAGAVCKASEREVEHILEECGLSADDVLALAEERCSSKWAYDSGLSHVLEPFLKWEVA